MTTLGPEVPGVPGLFYYPNVLTDEQQQEIVDELDTRFWDESVSRRTQHGGYRYPYDRSRRLISASSVEGEEYQGLYPIAASVWLSHLQNYLATNFGYDLDQVIVNEYGKGDAIGRHTDDQVLFGDTIVSFSLLYPTNMKFRHYDTVVDVLLEPGSMVIMTGEARYQFTHEILKRTTVDIRTASGSASRYKKPDDYRRVSVTFRQVIATSAR